LSSRDCSPHWACWSNGDCVMRGTARVRLGRQVGSCGRPKRSISGGRRRHPLPEDYLPMKAPASRNHDTGPARGRAHAYLLRLRPELGIFTPMEKRFYDNLLNFRRGVSTSCKVNRSTCFREFLRFFFVCFCLLLFFLQILRICG